MNVRELRTLLNNGANDNPDFDNLEVVIPVVKKGSMGPIPKVNVKSIHEGFDWDNGMLLIYPESKLTIKE